MTAEIISDSSSENFCGPIKPLWGAAATRNEKETRRQRRRSVVDMMQLRCVVNMLRVVDRFPAWLLENLTVGNLISYGRLSSGNAFHSWQATSARFNSPRHIFEQPKFPSREMQVKGETATYGGLNIFGAGPRQNLQDRFQAVYWLGYLPWSGSRFLSPASTGTSHICLKSLILFKFPFSRPAKKCLAMIL